MPVSANTSYALSAWLQASLGRQAGLRVIEWRNDFAVLADKTVAASSGASSGWSEVKGSFVTGSTTSFVQIRLMHSVPGIPGTGTFFWDDIALSLGDSIAPNSSFESGTGTGADNWAPCQTSGSASFSIATSPVRTGLRSVRMDVTQSGDSGVCSSFVSVAPNTTYALSAWLKAPLNQRAALRIIEWTSSFSVIADKVITASSGELVDWEMLQDIFVTEPNTSYVQIRLMHSLPGTEGTGTFYWDDIALLPLTGALEETNAHLCPAQQAPPACNESSTVNQWQCWQKTLVSTKYTNINAYRDLEITVEFLDSEKVVRTGWGFWDCRQGNQDVFRIRTALPPGNYTWRTQCKGRAGGPRLDCSGDLNKTGTFTVAPASVGNDRYDRGFLTLSANRRFLRQGNTTLPYFWLADTAWDAVKQANRGGDWATYLDTRKKQGFTAVLLATAPHTANISPNEVFEKLGTCKIDSSVLPNNCSRWLPAYWQQYEAKIQDANAKGLVAVVVGLMEPFASHSDPKLGRPQWLSIFARNLAARLAGHHVIFSPGFDIVVKPQTQAMANAVGNAIDKAVPAHLITHHAAGRATCDDYTTPFQTMPWHDFHVFQSGHCGQLFAPPTGQPMVCDPRRDLPLGSEDETADACVTRRAREMSLTIFNNTTKVKPAVNGEAVYDGNPANPGAADAPDNRAFVRQTAYLSALSGSFGFTYGTDYFAQWNVTPSTLSAYLGPVPATSDPVPPAANHSAWDMQRMASIFKQRSFRDFVPYPNLIRNQQTNETKKMVYARTNNLKYQLAYLPEDLNRDSIILDLSGLSPQFDCGDSGDWVISWLSPTSKLTEVSPNCRRVNSGFEFNKPQSCPNCEWVLAIDLVATSVLSPSIDVILEPWSEPDLSGSNLNVQIASPGREIIETIVVNESPSEFLRRHPVVARDGGRNFYLFWESDYQDGSMGGIFGRYFDNRGHPLGPEFLVNTQIEDDQIEPWAAASPSGDSVVVWMSFGQDGDLGGIYGQRYDRKGQPVGSEFKVNTTTQGNQGSPKVGMDPHGNFVVLWEDLEPDGKRVRIFGQTFDSTGRPSGLEFQIDPTGIYNQALADLKVKPNGAFEVSWYEYDQEENLLTTRVGHFSREGEPQD